MCILHTYHKYIPSPSKLSINARKRQMSFYVNKVETKFECDDVGLHNTNYRPPFRLHHHCQSHAIQLQERVLHINVFPTTKVKPTSYLSSKPS